MWKVKNDRDRPCMLLRKPTTLRLAVYWACDDCNLTEILRRQKIDKEKQVKIFLTLQ